MSVHTPSRPGHRESSAAQSCSAPRSRRWIGLLLALVAGAVVFAAGVAWAPQGATPAEVRRGPQREAFLSGGERSVPILEEIAATVRRIDTRLAHLEKLMQQAAEKTD